MLLKTVVLPRFPSQPVTTTPTRQGNCETNLPSTLCHQMELSHGRRMLSRRFSSLTNHVPQSISISSFRMHTWCLARRQPCTRQVQPPLPYIFDIIPVLYCTVYHKNMVGWSTTFARPLRIVFLSFTPCTFHVHTFFPSTRNCYRTIDRCYFCILLVFISGFTTFRVV